MIQAMNNLNLLQKKWYVIDSQTAKNKYNQNNSIKFETESIKSSLCDFLHVRQKLMMCLLMKQIIFTLQCLCTI